MIWQTYVPKSGQADYVQGELLRAIEKLRDEAHRNGNANFNEKCHGILIQYLRNKLTDRRVFDENTIVLINLDLDKLGMKDEPYLYDDVFDSVAHRIVDWCIAYDEPIPHKTNPELYC